MSMLSDFFLAGRSTTPNYEDGAGLGTSDRSQFKGITRLQAAQFLAVLRGRGYCGEMIGPFKLLTPEDADAWTMSVPDDLVEKLAAVQSDEFPESRRTEIEIEDGKVTDLEKVTVKYKAG
jgi:hypothetical protein